MWLNIGKVVFTGGTLILAWLGLEEAKRGNRYALWGIIIGVISTVAIIYIFLPEKEIKYDITNNYDDGTLRFIGNGTFENRKDTWKWYSKDGILIKLETYDNNELDGDYQEFYKNGNLKMQGKYDDGEKADEWRCFNSDGSTKKCLKS